MVTKKIRERRPVVQEGGLSETMSRALAEQSLHPPPEFLIFELKEKLVNRHWAGQETQRDKGV